MRAHARACARIGSRSTGPLATSENTAFREIEGVPAPLRGTARHGTALAQANLRPRHLRRGAVRSARFGELAMTGWGHAGAGFGRGPILGRIPPGRFLFSHHAASSSDRICIAARAPLAMAPATVPK